MTYSLFLLAGHCLMCCVPARDLFIVQTNKAWHVYLTWRNVAVLRPDKGPSDSSLLPHWLCSRPNSGLQKSPTIYLGVYMLGIPSYFPLLSLSFSNLCNDEWELRFHLCVCVFDDNSLTRGVLCNRAIERPVYSTDPIWVIFGFG